MAKRFVDTDIWDKEWFMALTCKGKCLIRFLYDKCDAAGVWSPNWSLATAYIGEKVTQEDLRQFGDRIEMLPDGKYFIVDFVNFQYGELSENCRPHTKIINLLKKHGIFERVSKGYLKSMQTLEEKDKDIDKEKEEEKDKEKGVIGGDEIIEIDVVEDVYLFENFWNDYDKKVGDKKKLVKKWNKISDKSKLKIRDHIPLYKKAQPDKKYRKNPETYLNNESWNDEIISNNDTRTAKTTKGISDDYKHSILARLQGGGGTEAVPGGQYPGGRFQDRPPDNR